MTAKKEPAPADTDGGVMIHKAMLAIMCDLEAIGKNKRNSSQGFNYRGVDDVYNELHPLLCKHGVYMTAQVLDKHREDRQTKSGGGLIYTSLTMRYSFVAGDGSTVATEAQGEGMDSGDKSSNKAMAVAHKYALFQAFCIPTEDMPDPDADTHHVQPRQPASPSHALSQTLMVEVDESTAIALTQALEGAKDQSTLDDIWKRNKDKLAALSNHRPQDFEACQKAAKARKAHFDSQQKA